VTGTSWSDSNASDEPLTTFFHHLPTRGSLGAPPHACVKFVLHGHVKPLRKREDDKITYISSYFQSSSQLACLATHVVILGMQKLLYSPWQALGVPYTLTPISQPHESQPSPVPGNQFFFWSKGEFSRLMSTFISPPNFPVFCSIFYVLTSAGWCRPFSDINRPPQYIEIT